MKFIKKYYLLLLLIITLAGATIYGTYAMFTSSVEVDMVNMDTNMSYTFDINGTQELKVSAGSKLRFNAIVKNSMDGKISYGLYYKMISPTTLPSGAIIAQVSDDLTMLAKGQLDSGTSKTVPMVIKNTSDSEITVEIGVRTGYATETQDEDDIIYNEGEIPITSFQTSEEAGNDSCTATMECTEECSSNYVNGEWQEVCYCYTGNNGSMPTVNNGIELGSLIKKMSNGVKDKIINGEKVEAGIWETQDDYGTTYYFRGNVTNNYVKFAGYYWRIVRINGDGSIRLIYDGTSAHANGESSSDKIIASSKYNIIRDDNAYVGYMYGSTGASSYNETHANINDSTIKTVVDNWYKTNISGKGYGFYIADVIYCNDRQVASNSGEYSGFGTLGYGKNNTIYAPHSRVRDTSFHWLNIQEIKMTCSQKNDAFTVNDTNKGNGDLTYPVGLITMDEAIASVAQGYLHSGQQFWSMTPMSFDNYVFVWNVKAGNGFGIDGAEVSLGVRPVLSLKPSVELTGNGTMTDPWVVQD